jgi:hypothetical protein
MVVEIECPARNINISVKHGQQITHHEGKYF